MEAERKVVDVCTAWDGAMQMYKEEGKEEGREKTLDSMNKFIQYMFRDGRQNELLQCAVDRELQNKLLMEYGFIESVKTEALSVV